VSAELRKKLDTANMDTIDRLLQMQAELTKRSEDLLWNDAF
jgi:hypothetical protein